MNFDLFQETIVNNFNHYRHLVQTAINENVDNFTERDEYIRRTNDKITRNLIIRHNCNIWSDTPGHEYNICYYIIHKWINEQINNTNNDLYNIDIGRACNVLKVLHEKGYDLGVELNRPFNGSNCIELLRTVPNIDKTRLGCLLTSYGVRI